MLYVWGLLFRLDLSKFMVSALARVDSDRDIAVKFFEKLRSWSLTISKKFLTEAVCC